MDDAYVTVGKLTKPHGVRGVMKLTSFTEPPENIFTYASLFLGTGKRSTKLTKKSQASPTTFLVDVDGVADRNKAELLTNTEVFAMRSDLPELDEETYYYVDLIGLSVQDSEGAVLGSVSYVDEFGAQVNLEVVNADKEKFYIPFTKEAVPDVQVSEGRIIVNPDFLIKQKAPKKEQD